MNRPENERKKSRTFSSIFSYFLKRKINCPTLYIHINVCLFVTDENQKMIEGSGKEGWRRRPLVGLISNYYLSYSSWEQMGIKLIVPINNIAKRLRSRKIRKKKRIWIYIYLYVFHDISHSDCICICVHVCWRLSSSRRKHSEVNQPNLIWFLFYFYVKISLA
jgi:hypothetical protein